MNDRDRPSDTVRIMFIFDELNGLLNKGLEEHQLYLVSKEIEAIRVRITNINSCQKLN